MLGYVAHAWDDVDVYAKIIQTQAIKTTNLNEHPMPNHSPTSSDSSTSGNKICGPFKELISFVSKNFPIFWVKSLKVIYKCSYIFMITLHQSYIMDHSSILYHFQMHKSNLQLYQIHHLPSHTSSLYLSKTEISSPSSALIPLQTSLRLG